MLPAHAGMILCFLIISFLFVDVTRTRGDDPEKLNPFWACRVCYPHTRG